MMKYLSLVFFLIFISACTGRPPFLEYSVAFTALESARAVNADKNAVAYWVKALRQYRQGEKRFRQRGYNQALYFFNESIAWAEKAENLSRLKIASGETEE